MSSLAEVLAEHTGALTFVPPAHLPLWLPDLAVPQGWDVGAVDGPTVTRMLLRRLGSSDHWDGCEVLNLYRVSGVVPEALVLDNADRSGEVAKLTDNVYRALLAGIDRARRRPEDMSLATTQIPSELENRP